MPRVLLIDDDRRLHELLSSYLEQNGFTVIGAPDGQRGLLALEAQPVDIVLLDIMMPGIDGLEVCRRIRLKSRVPIVMLTAQGDETDRVVGLELGADDYLAKPFGPRELVARLRAVLRRTNPDPAGERIVVNEISRSMCRGTACKSMGVKSSSRASSSTFCWPSRGALDAWWRATRCSAKPGAATSPWAIAPWTCTSLTFAKSSVMIPGCRRRSRLSAVWATCW